MTIVPCLALPLLAAAACAADPLPLLHPLFSDHMVFPRDRVAPVWGWAAPGTRVRVALSGASAEAVAGADGRWQAGLGPVAAGGPFQLTIDGPQHIVRSDVLVGEVWLFSGQSNMEMGLGGAEGGGEEVARAGEATGLRLLHLGKRASGVVRPVPPGAALTWQQPGPGTTGGFSAVAWFTGRALNRELQVPVGVVSCAWSGSNIRGWMSQDAIVRTGLYGDELARLKPLAEVEAAGGKSASEQEMDTIQAWWSANDPGTAAGWHGDATAIAAAPWKPVDVPATWREDGVAWLARDVTLPAEAAGRAAWLRLGAILNEEVTWVNGRQVGSTGGWTLPRSHRINAGVLRAGVNRIAIRVKAQNGQGAAAATAADWHLDPDGLAAIPLAGAWQFALSAPAAGLKPKPEPTFQGGNRSPTMMYNAGIAGLAPFAFSGVVWYQGEQDAGNPDYYRLLPALVADWRGAFASPQLPWVVVQLPAFSQPSAEPVQPQVWFGLVRDAQLSAARTVPGVGLAVTTDLGDANDVHPRKKREVGERAAHAALAVAYGRADGGGPLFAGAEVAGNAMRVRFSHVHGALSLRQASPSGFAVAGADRVWRHAVVRLDGDVLVVASPEVPAPVAVRYGWAENPPVTLFDAAGMPASPFRSDAW
jgi:sialate O-acetylesterase